MERISFGILHTIPIQSTWNNPTPVHHISFLWIPDWVIVKLWTVVIGKCWIFSWQFRDVWHFCKLLFEDHRWQLHRHLYKLSTVSVFFVSWHLAVVEVRVIIVFPNCKFHIIISVFVGQTRIYCQIFNPKASSQGCPMCDCSYSCRSDLFASIF